MHTKGRKRSTETLAEHLWRSVVRGADDECWLWTGAKTSQGYGQLTHHSVHYFVHRLAYALHHGAPYHYERMVDGRQVSVCHACDVRLCVNPNHLWKGTQSENMLDAVAKGRLKLSPFILANVEQGRLRREAKALEKEQRRLRMALGVEKKRNAMGQFGEGPVRVPLRDALGRMIKKGQKLPARQRDAAGLFI